MHFLCYAAAELRFLSILFQIILFPDVVRKHLISKRTSLVAKWSLLANSKNFAQMKCIFKHLFRKMLSPNLLLLFYFNYVTEDQVQDFGIVKADHKKLLLYGDICVGNRIKRYVFRNLLSLSSTMTGKTNFVILVELYFFWNFIYILSPNFYFLPLLLLGLAPPPVCKFKNSLMLLECCNNLNSPSDICFLFCFPAYKF